MRGLSLSFLTILIISCTQSTKDEVSNENEAVRNINSSKIDTNEERLETVAFYDSSLTNDYVKIEQTVRIFPKPILTKNNRLDTLTDKSVYSGVFFKKVYRGKSIFEIRKVNVKVDYYKSEGTGAIYPTYYSDTIVQPLFIVEGITYPDPYEFKGKIVDKQTVLPGDQFYYSTDKAKYYMCILGDTKFNISKSFGQQISRIDNVKLLIQEQFNKKLTDTLIYNVNLVPWGDGSYEGCISIHWVGDIDLDGRLDMLIGYSNHYAFYEYTLFLSKTGLFNASSKYVVPID